MPEYDRVYGAKVIQSGIFEYKELYRYTYNWLVDNNYDVTEKKYSEKINPNGKEVEIEWDSSRKISDYFKFQIKVAWKIMGMTTVEVEKNGAKLKMQKANVEIRTSSVLIKDYEHRWEDNPFYKWLRTLYDRYLIRTRITDYEMKLIGETDEFLAQIKSFLALEGQRATMEASH